MQHNKRYNKKSQMTIFIILAFIIFISFLFISAVVSQIKVAKLKIEAKNSMKSFLNSNIIKQHITSCMDLVLTDGLEKIGLQGGRIYLDQGGLTNFSKLRLGNSYEFINLSDYPELNRTETVNISYGLKISENNGTYPFYPDSFFNPPEYPASNKHLTDINGFNVFGPIYEGYYGHYVLPRLCNSPAECSVLASTEFFDHSNEYTIQEQLETYVKQHLKECINLTIFEQKTPYTIRDGNITPKINFNINSVSLKIDYPITIAKQGTQPLTQIMHYSINKKIRLKKIYTFIYDLLKYESFDLFFDIRKYLPSFLNLIYPFVDCTMSDFSKCIDSDISLMKYENAFTDTNGTYDDLIIVQDNNSLINNKPYLFVFAIQNRRPALDYIDRGDGTINIYVLENQTIHLTPEAYDPDNTPVTYTYSGWRENYYTLFNRTCYEEGNGFNSCFRTINQQTHNWTQSSEFIQTQQNASYTPQYGELGLHTVTIKATDEAGLSDWQNISILVFDLPTAIITGNNFFDDINNSYASVEDPYLLNGSLSYVIIGGNYSQLNYHWYENVEPIDITTESSVLNLPLTQFNIINITNKVFNKSKLESNNNRTTTVSLQVAMNNIYGTPDNLYLNIFQCLPHRSSDIIYPYGQGNFSSNHSCCNTNPFGTIKDSSNLCYNKVLYSSFKFWNESEFKNARYYYDNYLPDFNGTLTTINFGSVNFEESNDIFKLDFKRYCDGTRGNICAGNGRAELQDVQQCKDYLKFNATKRCYGPPIDLFETNLSTQPNCVVYNRKTFETLNNDNSENIPCRTQPKCYSGDSNFNKGNGGTATQIYNLDTGISPILCEKAYCDGSQINSNTGNCDLTFDNDCYCSTNCSTGVSSECDHKDPGYSWSSSGSKKESGCNLSCKKVTCTPYIFNANTLDCYTSCSNDNFCDDAFICDTSEHNCTQCNGVLQNNLCEKDCGADHICDEHAPNTIVSNKYCDQDCEAKTCKDLFGEDYAHVSPEIIDGSVSCNCSEINQNVGYTNCDSGYICINDLCQESPHGT